MHRLLQTVVGQQVPGNDDGDLHVGDGCPDHRLVGFEQHRLDVDRGRRHSPRRFGRIVPVSPSRVLAEGRLERTPGRQFDGPARQVRPARRHRHRGSAARPRGTRRQSARPDGDAAAAGGRGGEVVISVAIPHGSWSSPLAGPLAVEPSGRQSARPSGRPAIVRIAGRPSLGKHRFESWRHPAFLAVLGHVANSDSSVADRRRHDAWHLSRVGCFIVR